MTDRKRPPEDARDEPETGADDAAPRPLPTERTPEEPDEGLVGGRSGGRLARQIGTRDELKRAYERPAGATRVRKGDEDEDDRT